MIKHLLMWKLKDPADAPRFKAALERCIDLVPGMRTFEIAIRQDGLEANCDVVLNSAFDDATALQAYIVHSVHQEVVGVIRPLAEARYIVDYEV